MLSLRYPRLEFAIGGQISVDIYPRGRDKSQALNDWSGESVFFGDSCGEGGNDYTIAQQANRFHQVAEPKETRYIINSYYTA